MTRLRTSSYRYSSIERTLVRQVAKPAILRLQRYQRLFPHQFCLISGAPRSGTTALCSWLKQQPDAVVFQESRILVSIHKFITESDRFSALQSDSVAIAALARQLVVNYYADSSILLGKRLLVDKEPLEPIAFPAKDYGSFLRNVRRIFPDGKLLLTIREPTANVWSMTQRTWGGSLAGAEARTFILDEYLDDWCSCADLVLELCGDSRTYVVQYGRLINDPAGESKRIAGFLGIPIQQVFQARPTKQVGFSAAEHDKILCITEQRVRLLRALGIAELS